MHSSPTHHGEGFRTDVFIAKASGFHVGEGPRFIYVRKAPSITHRAKAHIENTDNISPVDAINSRLNLTEAGYGMPKSSK